MNEQQTKAIEYFKRIGKKRVDFHPAIKIKETPHSYPVWIDDMVHVRDDHYMVTISNQENENMKKSLLFTRTAWETGMAGILLKNISSQSTNHLSYQLSGNISHMLMTDNGSFQKQYLVVSWVTPDDAGTMDL